MREAAARRAASRAGQRSLPPAGEPYAALVERELACGPHGVSPVDTLAVFLVGRECPFGCVFCDLWRYTTPGPTPPGALPAQLARALPQLPRERRPAATLKLYNASNFDRLAVPPADLAAMAEVGREFARVVVECHPRRVGDLLPEFAAALGPTVLEVAMGLETVDPRAMARLGKSLDLAIFDRAAVWLRTQGMALRVFVLVGAPFVPDALRHDSTVASVAHALARGASHVSLIPVRPTPDLVQLTAEGEWTPPTLDEVEAAFDAARVLAATAGGVVTVDLWDMARRWPEAPALAARLARLERLNLVPPIGEARPPHA